MDRSSSLIIRDLPPTLRYLNRNFFGLGNGSPREMPKQIISETRSIFYSQMSIESKKDESLKLREYIIMEGEKLEEAKRSFVEDQIKFTKYLSDIDTQADKAKD